jgi:hypothetical protein
MLQSTRGVLVVLLWLSSGSAQGQTGNGSARADVIRAPASDTRALSAAEQKVVKDAITNVLIDPTTPLFKLGPQILTSSRYCGFVNGKNRLGGYAGFQSFSVEVARNIQGQISGVNNVQIVTSQPDLPAIEAAKGCLQDGYPFVL